MTPTHRRAVSSAPWTDRRQRETDSSHQTHSRRDNTQQRVLLIALVLSFAVSGCLADPRTDAQLDENISTGVGTGPTSTKCSTEESSRLLKPKSGVIMAITTCMTRPNNNCIPGSTCVAFCVDNFESGEICHTCLKKNVAGCVTASCVDACELDAHTPLCPSCVEDCGSCMAKKCAKAIQRCSAD